MAPSLVALLQICCTGTWVLLVDKQQRHTGQSIQLNTVVKPLDTYSFEQLMMNPNAIRESVQNWVEAGWKSRSGQGYQRRNNMKFASPLHFQ